MSLDMEINSFCLFNNSPLSFERSYRQVEAPFKLMHEDLNCSVKLQQILIELRQSFLRGIDEFL